MGKHLISRTEIKLAPPGENTHGLSAVREVWETGQGERVYWKYSLPNVVQIFGMTEKGLVIAVSEFQPGVGTDYLHLPAETMERGESPLETARRGLLEETGFETGSAELLSSILENSGRSDRLVHIVLATGCRKTDREGEEAIQTTLISPSNFWHHLIGYFGADPVAKHGGGNSLKAAALALERLGLLRCTQSPQEDTAC